MTQGYGPEHGQQPQWGQASPAPAVPGGYPGAAGSAGPGAGPQFGPGDGVNWRRVKLIGLLLLGGTVLVLLLRLGINLATRSEEHTSELQSRFDLVCRLLLEKKKQKNKFKRD